MTPTAGSSSRPNPPTRRRTATSTWRLWLTAGLASLASLAWAPGASADPLSRNPTNGHYFSFRGAPTVLITSGEHYGAVLNLDFDYVPYLDELRDKGLNLTRLFSGTYVETPNSFGIEKNTLGPLSGRYSAPWLRSSKPGYAGGGNKFDLSQFDPAYFARLKDFIGKAGERGIVVELVLFCVSYDDTMWNLSPMNAANNVNGLGNGGRETALSVDNTGLLAVQDAFVRETAKQLTSFDNLYYEVVNEPYFGVSDAFQDHVTTTLADAEAKLPVSHLIARNYCNESCEVKAPNPKLSILNFHYASPPTAVATNFGLNLPLAFDETGFKGSGDDAYRKQAWSFIVAGGAVFSNLDYSFTAENESGDFKHTNSPGGGSSAFRAQLQVLHEFIDGFDFVDMAPNPSVIKGGVPQTAHVLAQVGHQYAIYLDGGAQANLQLDLPADTYMAKWLDPKTGDETKMESFVHQGGTRLLASPTYDQEAALAVRTLAEVNEMDAVAKGGAPGSGGQADQGGVAGVTNGGTAAGGPSLGGIAGAGNAGEMSLGGSPPLAGTNTVGAPTTTTTVPTQSTTGCGCRLAPTERAPVEGALAALALIVVRRGGRRRTSKRSWHTIC